MRHGGMPKQRCGVCRLTAAAAARASADVITRLRWA
jgi:hypothetical protein